MTRAAYIWIIASVAAALLFHALEERHRTTAIRDATKNALFVGVKAGCEDNNKIRNQVWQTAEALHPAQADEVRSKLKREDCTRRAAGVVKQYLDHINR